jgi:peptide/nickel transport system ATP-binding protein
MTEPTLAVEGLRTHFTSRQGVVKAVDDVSFSVAPGKIMGLVGESGSGKSVTGYSIMGLVDPPGRIVGGRVLLKQGIWRPSDCDLRRGNRFAMVFQDPMMTLNPVLRIDTQMIGRSSPHEDVDERRAPDRVRQRVRDARWRGWASPPRTNACAPIRTSSPAACASASPSRSRC